MSPRGEPQGRWAPKDVGVLGRSADAGKEQRRRARVCSEARGGGTRGCGAEAAPTHLSQQGASSGLDAAPTLTSSHLLYCTPGSWGSMLGGELTWLGARQPRWAHGRAGPCGQ